MTTVMDSSGHNSEDAKTEQIRRCYTSQPVPPKARLPDYKQCIHFQKLITLDNMKF